MKILSVVLVASMLPMGFCGYGQNVAGDTAPTAKGGMTISGIVTDSTGGGTGRVVHGAKLNSLTGQRFELAQADTKGYDNMMHNLTVLVSPKMVKAAYMGVTVVGSDKTLQSQLKLPEGVGLVVQNVDEKGPAAGAGLKENDVITRFGDQMVINADQFEVLVRAHKMGDSVEVTVIREAEAMKLTVTLMEKEEPELAWTLNSHHPFSYSTPAMVNGGTLYLQGAGTGGGAQTITVPGVPVAPSK